MLLSVAQVSRALKAKRSSFRSPSTASASRPKSCARKNSSPKAHWSNWSSPPRIERCPIAAPEVNAALVQLRAGRVRDGHYTLRAHSGPRVFAQTNDKVAESLANLIAGILSGEGRLLIDAFCGAGFFSKRLAHQF